MPRDVAVTVARPEEPFRAVVRKQLEVPEGRETAVELSVPDVRDDLTVAVEDDAGRPVKLAQITALSVDAENPLRATAFSDESGRAVVHEPSVSRSGSSSNRLGFLGGPRSSRALLRTSR